MTGREGLPVDFPQRSNIHRPVPVTDLPISVVMSMAMKDSLSHGALLPRSRHTLALGSQADILRLPFRTVQRKTNARDPLGAFS
jgi:hypothetical protein